MDLRELKKEVHSLPNFSEQLQKFRDSWVKPIKSNTNKHLPFLQNLSPEKNVKSLAYKYHHINELLHHEAPLEESVHFMHLPHQEHLQILLSTSRKQKTLVKDLGEHFVALAKQTRRKA